MFDTVLLPAFIAAATLLTITPGVDTAMVLRSATVDGPRSGALAGLGIVVGCLVWGAAVAVGLGALLHVSELAYTAVKLAGAAYLIYLGVRLILKPRGSLDLQAQPSGHNPGLAAFVRGFTTNLLNPKIGVFYVTFLPQFIPYGADVAAWSFLLACIHGLLGLIWFSLLIAATAPLGRLIRRPGVVTLLDRLTGGVFILFGLKLALSRD